MKKTAQRFNAKMKYYDDDNIQITASNKSVFGYTETDAEYEAAKLQAYKERRAAQMAAAQSATPSSSDSGELSTAETEKDSSEERKRNDNLLRAKRKVYDIAYANGDEWRYMVTLTLDGSKVDRYSSDAVLKPFQDWLKNCVKRKGLKALIVPEYHSDGAIHFHGLFNDSLKLSDCGTVKAKGYKKPLKLSTAKRYGVKPEDMKPVYNCDDWKKGFSTFVPLDDNTAAVCGYITKYITKDFEKIFGKFYFAVGQLRRELPVYYFDLDVLEMLSGGGEQTPDIASRKAPYGDATYYYLRTDLDTATNFIDSINAGYK